MITLPKYQVMGEDGQEYGPVSAEQIHKWFLEQRLERKTPVKPAEAQDWVFLESLPEFAGWLQPAAPSPKQQPRKWPLVVMVVLAVGLIVLALIIFNHH